MTAPFYSEKDILNKLKELSFNTEEVSLLLEATARITPFELRELFIFLESLSIDERQKFTLLTKKKIEILKSGNTAAWQVLLTKEKEITR
ncbi:MAG: hypothetical protein WCJ29_01650 [bacterium]